MATTKVKLEATELGVTGLRRYGQRSLIQEEFLRELSGAKAIRTYREMRDNDPIIGAMMFAIEMLTRNVTWRVEGPDEELNTFVEECMIDMSHTWEDFVTEALSMLTYGFSWHEIVYKRRSGPSDDSSLASKFNDGKIGWKKIPIRAQDTLYSWDFTEEGDIEAFVQIAPPNYTMITIPMDRSLLFRFSTFKGNPEGRSILRNSYRPWFFKRHIEDIEGIGIERDLAGLPVIYRSPEAAVYDEDLKRILRNVRRDEQDGLLLPQIFDEKGNKLVDFQLMNSGGTRQIDVSGVIDRYNKTIATTVLADFILMGQQAVGSFALASSKTEMFSLALGTILKQISSIMNRVAIPRLLALNGITVDKTPELVPGDVETPDLKELGAYISTLAGSGMPLFPDEKLENYLRQVANLPKKQEDNQQPVTPIPSLNGED